MVFQMERTKYCNYLPTQNNLP